MEHKNYFIYISAIFGLVLLIAIFILQTPDVLKFLSKNPRTTSLESKQIREDSQNNQQKNLKNNSYHDNYETSIMSLSNKIIQALKNKDFKAIAYFVDTKEGLIVSPYYYVNKDTVRLTKEDTANFINSESKRMWGYQDGSGLPIELTGKEYYEKWIFTHDFTKADIISYNTEASNGNNYPVNVLIQGLESKNEIRYVEYYFKGFDPAYVDMDWEALLLIFSKIGNTWYLSGILHNNWTI